MILYNLRLTGDRMVERIRRTKSGIKQLLFRGMFFEEMGIIYLGPVDGGDMQGDHEAASHIDGTGACARYDAQGEGTDRPAERHPARFHCTEPFEIETGLRSTTMRIIPIFFYGDA